MEGYPRIRKPGDIKLLARLEKKLLEYEQRKLGKDKPWAMQAPSLAHQTYSDHRDACYKFEVLKAVLQCNTTVDTFEVATELSKRYGKNFNAPEFIAAAKVIAGHCGDTKITLTGGTGLPAK